MPEYSGSGDLAYVIYTSGTTGKPKGIMIENKQFSSFIQDFEKRSYIQSTENMNVLSLTSYVFDIFGLEFALPLSFGGTIYLSDFMHINEAHLSKSSILQQTPTIMLNITQRLGHLVKDKLCLVGGESLPAEIGSKLLTCFNQVVNVYGPAECTIWSSDFPLDEKKKVLIGKPLYNEKIHILDNGLNHVPVGVVGELCVGGSGLARGYLNRPELTAERFIANPFATEADKERGYARLYKTGDLARWLPDGNIEYMGRNDFQVKIRGLRIELGEIESAVSQIPDINQVHVLAKKNKSGDLYLAAYYVSEQVLDAVELVDRLRGYLPEYMIPSVFVHMVNFPLTVNGKLDRKALPEPDFKEDQDLYVAPRSALEYSIADVWLELLEVEKVGIHDNFFRLGGHSLLVSIMLLRVGKLLDRKVDLLEFMRSPTIANLTNKAEADNSDLDAIITADMRLDESIQPLRAMDSRRRW